MEQETPNVTAIVSGNADVKQTSVEFPVLPTSDEWKKETQLFKSADANSTATPKLHVSSLVTRLDSISTLLNQLLHLPQQDFWKQVLWNDSLHKFFHSFTLHFRKTSHLLKYRLSNSNYIKQLLNGISILVLRILLLIFPTENVLAACKSTSRSSSIATASPSDDVVAQLPFINFPFILEIAAIFHHSNPEIVRSLVTSIYKSHSKLRQDLQNHLMSVFSLLEQLFDCVIRYPNKDNTPALRQRKSSNPDQLVHLIELTSDLLSSCESILDAYHDAIPIAYNSALLNFLVRFYECAIPTLRNELGKMAIDVLSYTERETYIEELNVLQLTMLKIAKLIIQTSLLDPFLQPQSSSDPQHAHSISVADKFVESIAEFDYYSEQYCNSKLSDLSGSIPRSHNFLAHYSALYDFGAFLNECLQQCSNPQITQPQSKDNQWNQKSKSSIQTIMATFIGEERLYYLVEMVRKACAKNKVLNLPTLPPEYKFDQSQFQYNPTSSKWKDFGLYAEPNNKDAREQSWLKDRIRASMAMYDDEYDDAYDEYNTFSVDETSVDINENAENNINVRDKWRAESMAKEKQRQEEYIHRIHMTAPSRRTSQEQEDYGKWQAEAAATGSSDTSNSNVSKKDRNRKQGDRNTNMRDQKANQQTQQTTSTGMRGRRGNMSAHRGSGRLDSNRVTNNESLQSAESTSLSSSSNSNYTPLRDRGRGGSSSRRGRGIRDNHGSHSNRDDKPQTADDKDNVSLSNKPMDSTPRDESNELDSARNEQQQQRRHKEANKAKHANHNRKALASRKAAGFTPFPS